jgi:type VI protein secretion system component Hcp
MTTGDDDSDIAAGASRRSVLRGGALGVGALVGAMAVVNANEVSSEAQQAGSSARLFVGFAGINLNHSVPLHSFGVGGRDDNGSLVPTLATLTLEATKYSPKLLKAYAEHTNLSSILISQFKRNVEGVETRYMDVTLNAARIVSFHTDVQTDFPGHVRDSLVVSFGGVTIHRFDFAKTYTWTLPT